MAEGRSFKKIRTLIQHLASGRLGIIALLLCVPAFFIHLGLVAFIGDEGIRTLVALEMKLSGQYIVPTLNGSGYFNKPPLFNWFILISSWIFGHFGEWPTRMTSLTFLGLFAFTVFQYSKKYFDQITSLSLAFMLLTSGRILFWDSMLGLIDICFSWIIYLNFLTLYHFGSKEKWKQLFVISYLLCSIAFLLKGLPAVVFQGLSVFTALIFHQAIKKKILSADHFIGIGLGLIPMLVYYFFYARLVLIENVISVLWDQSVQRTGVQHGIWKTISHVFTFPLEQSYHFLPYSLLIVFFFHRQSMTLIRRNPFVHFCFWMLVVNLPVYWFSVQVYPRYLLMFLPLFNLIGFYLLQQLSHSKPAWWKLFHLAFTITIGLICLSILVMPIFDRVAHLPGINLIWVLSSLSILVCFICLISDPHRMFIWVPISLLVIRSVFNLVVLPLRSEDFAENKCREDIRRAATNLPDTKWLIFGKTETHEVARYYTSAYTHQIIHKTTTLSDANAIYLVDRTLYPDFPGKKIDSLLLERGQILALMKPDQ